MTHMMESPASRSTDRHLARETVAAPSRPLGSGLGFRFGFGFGLGGGSAAEGHVGVTREERRGRVAGWWGRVGWRRGVWGTEQRSGGGRDGKR